MNGPRERPRIEAHVDEIRSAFDRSFAEPLRLSAPATEDLLALRVRGDAHALRVNELTALVADRRVVAVPARRPELLGLAGIRGAVVAVYDLAALLGYESAATRSRWLAVCNARDPIALALDDFDGFLRVAREEVREVDATSEQPRNHASHVSHVVRTGGVLRRIIDTRSMLRAIEGTTTEED